MAAIALATYLKTVFPAIPVQHLAALIVVAFTVIHSLSIRLGSYSHNFLTVLKIVLILLFILAASRMDQAQNISILPKLGDFDLISSRGFAVSLIYVSFAYSGWNAAIYVGGDLRNPQQNLPKALFLGTLLVLVLYIFLNYVFLYTVSISDLSGQIEVGFLSGSNIFGQLGGKLISLVIAFLLLSTVSGHVFIGPRITQVMGEDYHALRILKIKSRNGIPVNSFIFQLAIMLILIYSATFEQVMIYAGFTLNLMTTLTVTGVFILRRRKPDLARPYQTWGYPVTPAIFLLMSIWTLTFVLLDKPVESSIGIGIVFFGLGIYLLNEYLAKKQPES